MKSLQQYRSNHGETDCELSILFDICELNRKCKNLVNVQEPPMKCLKHFYVV